MKILFKTLVFFSLIALHSFLWPQPGKAQEAWQLSGAQMKVKGTSSLHDWEMKVENMVGGHQLEIDNSRVVIREVSIEVPVSSIKSDSKMMDSKAYKALKSERYPIITFKSAGPLSYELKSNTFSGSVSGELTIAGVSRKIDVPVSGSINKGVLQIQGWVNRLNMKDFNIDPPTAMMGTLKTGETVNIEFQLNFKVVSKTASK